MSTNNIIVNIPYFFRDFVGNMEDFRILLQNLNAGTAGTQYGTPEEQQQLLAELHRGFVGGHPTMSTDSVDEQDFGEWLYYNGVFYPTNGSGGGSGTQGPAGPAGAQGPAGPAGAAGPRGMQGTQGFQGEIGIQGIQGTAGNIFMVQGIQGIQGIQGYPGMIVSGVIGENGEVGIMGIQGIAGIQGPAGVRGTKGTQGTQGTQGITGAQGIQGIQGPQGTDGIQGITGTQGIQGYLGYIGIQGIQGPQGTDGIQGYPGLQGTQGAQGYLGYMGIQGIQGGELEGIRYYVEEALVYDADADLGDLSDALLVDIIRTEFSSQTECYEYIDDQTAIHGVSHIISWSDAENLPYDPTQSSSVNTWAYRVIEESESMGYQGYRGMQGTQGIQGIEGIRGIQGTQGAQGPDGLQGIQGIQGTQGTQYIVAGMMGAQGIQGAQGPIGFVGMQGIQGIDGTQGYPGIQGADYIFVCYGVQGTQGIEGIQGDTGIQGIQGLSGINDAFFDIEINLADPNLTQVINYEIADEELTILYRWRFEQNVQYRIGDLMDAIDSGKQLRVHLWDENGKESFFPASIYYKSVFGHFELNLKFRLDVSAPVQYDRSVQTTMGSYFYDIFVSCNISGYTLIATISKGFYNTVARNETGLQNAITLGAYNSHGSYLINPVHSFSPYDEIPREFGHIANEQSHHVLCYEIGSKDDWIWIIDHHRDWYQSGKPSWTIVDARQKKESFDIPLSFDWNALRYEVSKLELLQNGAPDRSVFFNKIHKLTLILDNGPSTIRILPTYVTGNCDILANTDIGSGYMISGSSWFGYWDKPNKSYNFDLGYIPKYQGVPFTITVNIVALPTPLLPTYADDFLQYVVTQPKGEEVEYGYGVTLMMWNELPTGHDTSIGSEQALTGWHL